MTYDPQLAGAGTCREDLHEYRILGAKRRHHPLGAPRCISVLRHDQESRSVLVMILDVTGQNLEEIAPFIRVFGSYPREKREW